MSDVLVLCYHAISDEWPAVLAVTRERLERQLRSLVGRGYQGVTFHDAVTRQRPGRVLAVTFDDAYRSIFTLARPVLDELGLPGTVFAPTRFPGSERPMSWEGVSHWADGPHRDELTPMSWEELAELAADGWEVGSHTRTHPHLTQLDGGSLRDELEGSRGDCENRLGAPCRSIAYPYGDHDATVVRATRDAGYVVAGALAGLVPEPGPLAWPRVGVYRLDAMTRFRLKVSRGVRLLQGSPAWRLRGRRRDRPQVR